MSKVLDSDGRIYEATQKVSPGAAKAYEQACQPAEAEGVGKWSELKKLAEKATPGPWWVDSHGHRVSTEDGMQTVFIAADKMGPATRHPETGNLSHWPNDWDASYIVNASPDKILELIAALSAVTAERDAALASLERAYANYNQVSYASTERGKQIDQLRAEVEALRPDATLGSAIQRACRDLPEGFIASVSLEKDAGTLELCLPDTDAVLDDFDGETFADQIHAAIDAAMAAKEPEPEHVCSGCGAKGWTGNCLECIPY